MQINEYLAIFMAIILTGALSYALYSTLKTTTDED